MMDNGRCKMDDVEWFMVHSVIAMDYQTINQETDSGLKIVD